MLNVRPSLRRFLPWLHLPLGVLLALLQRAPAVRVLAGARDIVAVSPAGQLLRAAFTAATLGALHSRAGATTFSPSEMNPVRGTVGTPFQFAFTYVGTPSSPARFEVSGSLPPGLRFIPAASGSTINSGSPAIAGVPTQAGNFTIFVQGFNAEGLTNNIQQQIEFVITGAAAVAPTITTQPQSQTVTVGGSVTLTVAATGSPAPLFQWTKNGANIIGATSTTLALTNVQLSDAGAYTVVATNDGGSVPSSTATITVNPAGGGSGPATITAQPVSQRVASGSTVVFNVAANNANGYEWRRNGAPIPDATTSTLVLRNTAAAHAGNYTVLVRGAAGSATSTVATLAVEAGADFARLVNLSIFTDISAADQKFTLGTVIGGAGTGGAKPLLVRAAGPSLAQLGVTDALPDPKVDVFAGAALAASNDNWSGAGVLITAFMQVGAFSYASPDSRDAAVFSAATAAGAYTIDISGVGAATGPVIAELYDASPVGSVTAETPRLVNVSVLKQIGAGATLTAGFVIGGGTTGRTVLIRAIGPTLGAAPFHLDGAMADPKLELFSGPNVVAANDNWGGDAQLTAVGRGVGAFALANAASRDAILLVTLAPGSYTAQVNGLTGGGAALVEVYEVP